METTEQTTPTWQSAIAEAARDALTAHGAVIVRQGTRQAPEVASRLYAKADYLGSRYHEIAWTRARRMWNEDSAANFYVVSRHDDCLIVWNGRHCMLCEVSA